MKRILMTIAMLLITLINMEAGAPPKPGGGTAKPQPSPPAATFKPQLRCSGFSSDVAFFLKVTNDGPGDAPKGTRIAYSYNTSNGKHVYGQQTLQSALEVNQTEGILINTAWQTVVVSCKCYVK